MGIVHVAIYEGAVKINGDYQPYAPTPAETSLRAAIATAGYGMADRSGRPCDQPATTARARP